MQNTTSSLTDPTLTKWKNTTPLRGDHPLNERHNFFRVSFSGVQAGDSLGTSQQKTDHMENTTRPRSVLRGPYCKIDLANDRIFLKKEETFLLAEGGGMVFRQEVDHMKNPTCPLPILRGQSYIFTTTKVSKTS
jgi:hypothetical protein